MFRGDPAHTGVYAGPAPRQFHRIKWKFPTGDRIVSSPVWSEGVIYFAGDDGNIYAVDAESGRQLWKHRTGGPAPIHAGGCWRRGLRGQLRRKTLRARCGLRQRAVEICHGRRTPFRSKGDSRLAAEEPDDCRSVRCLSFEPGRGAGRGLFRERRWQSLLRSMWRPASCAGNFQTGDVVHASPAYADGVLFFGSWDSYFYAVDAATGKEKWRFHGGEDPMIHNQVGFQSSPAVVDGVVYTGCRDSQLYALDAATGKEKWHFDNALSWVISSPAVAGRQGLLRDLGLESLPRCRRGHRQTGPASSRTSLHVFVAGDCR